MYPTDPALPAEVPTEAEPGRLVREGPDGAPFVRAVIALNILVFAAQVIIGGFASFMSVPESVLMRFGANFAGATIGEHRFETLVSSCFLHGSLLHIFFNMAAFGRIGALLERAVGTARMAIVFFASGVCGSLMSAIVGFLDGGERLSVGASGAICGVFAATIVLGYRLQGRASELARTVGRWLGITLLAGLFITGLDNAAHLGGSVAGAVVAILWDRMYVYSARSTAVVVGACALVLAASASLVLVRDLTDPYAAMRTSARLVYGLHLLDAGRCDEARHALEAAARVHPNFPDVIEVHGQAIDVRGVFAARCGRDEADQGQSL